MRVLVCFLASMVALAAGQNCPPEGVEYYPDNSECDRYSECRDGVYSEHLCPDGLLFNDRITNGRYPCEYTTEVNCEGRTGQQPAQPTEYCPRQWGYYGSGDAAQCGFFHNCVNGQAFKVNCPAGLAFSSSTYRCEWPDESIDCDSEAFLGFSCPPAGNNIQVLLRGFPQFRSPRDCRQFFICVNESPRLQFCQLGLVFNEETYTCDEPETVRGCETYYTPEELALYREQREKTRLAQERRQEQLNELRQQLAERRRQQQ
ncbi:hypothetical protein Pmani_016988 [Petrolisthes manimaculis]|uniref:Chitin-binding type-2 domain-containing protein n=1 Tax=Petrolisthes manimaculis TaxID=1843537 RepID=A0AAE1PMP9_9EUCA|nr:hypothetical protein Pmani_016988 [Petrolisthes manimaculis]